VASAERDGRSYIAVVLYSSETQVWKDAAKLLDYGFSNFQQITLAKPDEVVATLELDESDKLQVVPHQEFSISLPVEEKKNVETKLFLQPLPEKIEVGQVVGQQVFTVDGEEAGRVELLAANEIVPARRPYFRIAIYIICGFLVLRSAGKIWSLIRRRRRRLRRFNSYQAYRGY